MSMTTTSSNNAANAAAVAAASAAPAAPLYSQATLQSAIDDILPVWTAIATHLDGQAAIPASDRTLFDRITAKYKELIGQLIPILKASKAAADVERLKQLEGRLKMFPQLNAIFNAKPVAPKSTLAGRVTLLSIALNAAIKAAASEASPERLVNVSEFRELLGKASEELLLSPEATDALVESALTIQGAADALLALAAPAKSDSKAGKASAGEPPRPPVKLPKHPLITLGDAILRQYESSKAPHSMRNVYTTAPYNAVRNTPENQKKLTEDNIEFVVRGKLLLIPNKYRDTLWLNKGDYDELKLIFAHLKSQLAIRAANPRAPFPPGADAWIDMLDAFKDQGTAIVRSEEASLIKIEKLTKLLSSIKELIFSDQYPHFAIDRAVEYYLMMLNTLNIHKVQNGLVY